MGLRIVITWWDWGKLKLKKYMKILAPFYAMEVILQDVKQESDTRLAVYNDLLASVSRIYIFHGWEVGAGGSVESHVSALTCKVYP